LASDSHHTTLIHSLKKTENIASHLVYRYARIQLDQFVHDRCNALAAIQVQEYISRWATEVQSTLRDKQ
jgi:hypothetical protein